MHGKGKWWERDKRSHAMSFLKFQKTESQKNLHLALTDEIEFIMRNRKDQVGFWHNCVIREIRLELLILTEENNKLQKQLSLGFVNIENIFDKSVCIINCPRLKNK